MIAVTDPSVIIAQNEPAVAIEGDKNKKTKQQPLAEADRLNQQLEEFKKIIIEIKKKKSKPLEEKFEIETQDQGKFFKTKI